jgi:hypothetical protein
MVLNNVKYRLKICSGLAADINTTATKNAAVVGEPHWVTDGKDLYVFDGTDMIYIGGATLLAVVAAEAGDKLGLFGATPVVQPTTAISGATFAQNSGAGINEASTFDGYTISQVVAALRAIGALE